MCIMCQHFRIFSVVTVFDAVSAAILPVWVDFTSLKGLPCAPGPVTTRRGVLVTNIMVRPRAGVQVRAAWLGLYAHLSALNTVTTENTPKF